MKNYLKHFLLVVSVLVILGIVYWGGYFDGIVYGIDYIYDNDLQPEQIENNPWEQDKTLTRDFTLVSK